MTMYAETKWIKLLELLGLAMFVREWVTRTWVKTFVLLLKQWCWYSHSVYVNVKTRYTDIPSKYQNNKYSLYMKSLEDTSHTNTNLRFQSWIPLLFHCHCFRCYLNSSRLMKFVALNHMAWACVNLEDFHFHFHRFEKKSAGRHCNELENARSLAIP